MKNYCSKIQKDILSCNGIFNVAIEEHCADCENCRQFKQDWKILADLKSSPKIALANDFAIIKNAQKFSKQKKIQVTIRRTFGYAAAIVSGIAAIYTVMFHGPLPNVTDDILRQSWNWDSFEEKVFILNTATEISRQDITLGDNNDDEFEPFNEEIYIES